MTKLILTLLITITGVLAQAETYCSIDREDINSVEDVTENYFAGTVKSGEMFLFKPDGSFKKEFNFDEVSMENAKSYNDSVLITYSVNENGISGIVISVWDTSNKDNFLKTKAIALGKPEEILGLVVPEYRISVTCINSAN